MTKGLDLTSVELRDLLSDLRLAPCWAARRGYGSFLTFDFGERKTRVTKTGSREVGAIHLWIYMARWRLEAGGDQVDDAADAQAIDAALARFVGVAIQAVTLQPATVVFGGDARPTITLAPLEDAQPDDALWMLYLPEHRVLSFDRRGELMIGDDREPT